MMQRFVIGKNLDKGNIMLKYKDLENNIHAFEDDVNEDFLNKKIEELGLIAITNEEETAIREQKDIDNQVTEKKELNTLLRYLSNTDYMATKCSERKLDMETEYPDDYIKRENARIRINELKAILLQ